MEPKAKVANMPNRSILDFGDYSRVLEPESLKAIVKHSKDKLSKILAQELLNRNDAEASKRVVDSFRGE